MAPTLGYDGQWRAGQIRTGGRLGNRPSGRCFDRPAVGPTARLGEPLGARCKVVSRGNRRWPEVLVTASRTGARTLAGRGAGETTPPPLRAPSTAAGGAGKKPPLCGDFAAAASLTSTANICSTPGAKPRMANACAVPGSGPHPLDDRIALEAAVLQAPAQIGRGVPAIDRSQPLERRDAGQGLDGRGAGAGRVRIERHPGGAARSPLE